MLHEREEMARVAIAKPRPAFLSYCDHLEMANLKGRTFAPVLTVSRSNLLFGTKVERERKIDGEQKMNKGAMEKIRREMHRVVCISVLLISQ